MFFCVFLLVFETISCTEHDRLCNFWWRKLQTLNKLVWIPRCSSRPLCLSFNHLACRHYLQVNSSSEYISFSGHLLDPPKVKRRLQREVSWSVANSGFPALERYSCGECWQTLSSSFSPSQWWLEGLRWEPLECLCPPLGSLLALVKRQAPTYSL